MFAVVLVIHQKEVMPLEWPFNPNTVFWDRDTPRVMGDLLCRPTALGMLWPWRRRNILETGCGTGYIARMLAERGANVWGIDQCTRMLRVALEHERTSPLGVRYTQGSIAAMPYADALFSAVMCIGVVMYNPIATVLQCFHEAHRVLKPGGSLIVGMTDPSLYSVKDNPARSGESNWIQFQPLGGTKFRQLYRDRFGNATEDVVWNHDFREIWKGLARSFRVRDVRRVFIEPQHLLHPTWGDESDYPAYIVIKATKEE